MKKAIILSLIFVVLIYSVSLAQSQFNIMTTELPPFNFEKDGIIYGISTDTLLKIFDKLKSPIKRSSIKIYPWARAYNKIQEDKNTIVFSMARTNERENLFKWVGPITTFSLGLIAPKKKNIIITSVDDLKKYRIGTQLDSAPEQLLIKTGLDKKSFDRTSNAENNLKKLEADRIDMFAFSVPAAKYIMKKIDMEPKDYETVYVLQKVDLYYAFNKNIDDEIISKFNSALESIKKPDSTGNSEFDIIEKLYLEIE